jgi:hypothetical protein
MKKPPYDPEENEGGLITVILALIVIILLAINIIKCITNEPLP